MAYFAPNSDQGVYEAISHAAHARVSSALGVLDQVGQSGELLERQARTAVHSALENAAMLDLTVIVPAGEPDHSGHRR